MGGDLLKKDDRMTTVNRKILIIDDEPLILSSLLSLLSDRYEVITAEEGISGLSIFCENHPSLVLLDVNMPYINGIEVLARIRQMGSDVPVFMMTGRRAANSLDPSWTGRCAELGISGYLIKPISPDKLIRQIEKVVGVGEGG